MRGGFGGRTQSPPIRGGDPLGGALPHQNEKAYGTDKVRLLFPNGGKRTPPSEGGWVVVGGRVAAACSVTTRRIYEYLCENPPTAAAVVCKNPPAPRPHG